MSLNPATVLTPEQKERKAVNVEHEISALLDVPVSVGQAIVDKINADWLLDWSECTKEELETTARNTYQKLIEGDK